MKRMVVVATVARAMAVVSFAVLSADALACSVVIVGKNASSTGRVLVGHNEDDSGEQFVGHAIVPRRTHAPGTFLPAEPRCAATVPQVPETCSFFWSEVKNRTGGLSNADAFLNEHGVFVVSDNAATEPLKDEWTTLTEGGIYYNLRRAIAERATSARSAVDIATNLITRWGYAAPRGRIYTVADKDEAWTIQVLYGRRFVARRCPDDGVVVVPNCLTIGRLMPGDVVAPCVADEAARTPGYDYARRFQGKGRWRQPTDTLRWRHILRLAAGVDVGADFTYSVKPSRKVSPEDIQAALSTHYEGTPDEIRPYRHGADRNETYIPVCRFQTIESCICVYAATVTETELRLAPGSPCENTYRRFRPFSDGIPDELRTPGDPVARLERHLKHMTWDEYLSAQSRPTPRDGIVRFRFNGLRERVYYDAPCALEEGSGCEVAVVLVHGWGGGIGRAAELAPMKRALAAATAPGVVPPYVVAPLFPRNDRVRSSGLGAPDDLASWNASWNVKNLSLRGSPDDDWRGGGDAVGTRLSSFDVIDRIFSAFADRTRYPNLRRVVLTGFSAGGQFAGRYAATGKGVVRDGVEVAYVAMAPSTELRLDPDVRWHYGIKDRPRYSAALTEADMLGNLSERRVWRACGTKDVLAMPYTSLDSCPEAMMQGTNRFERFRSFERYLERFPAWARQVSFHPIDGVGHNTVVAHCIPEFVDFVLHGDRNVGRRDK